MPFFRKVEDNVVITLDHGRIVLASIGAFLLMSLVFLVGVLVGKAIFSYSAEAARLEAAREPQHAEAREDRPRDKPVYTFYDDVKKPSDQVTQPVGPAPVQTEEKQTPTAVPPSESAKAEIARAELAVETARNEKAAQAAAQAAALAAAQNPPAGEAGQLPTPSPERVGAPKTEKAPKAPTAQAPDKPAKTPARGGTYSLQIESYNERGKADQAAKRLSSKGLPAEVSPSQVGGVMWYRIHVGRFPSRDAAEKYRKEVLKAKGLDGIIISR